MRAVIIGAVESTHVAIRKLIETDGWELPLVVTLEQSLGHRHSDLTDLADISNAAGAQLLHVNNINEPDAIRRISDARPDYIFVIGWSQICGPGLMNIAPGKVIGYHPAALPRLRGRAAIPWTILNGEAITAGSLFYIDEDVDNGPILDQHYFHLGHEETATSLYGKHMEALGIMLERTLPRMKNGTAEKTEQDNSYATWAAKRTPRDGHIDWSMPANDILRLIRAVTHPYPGAFAQQGDKKWTLFGAISEEADFRYLASPGQVVVVDKKSFCVKCGTGTIRVTDWVGTDEVPPRLHSTLN